MSEGVLSTHVLNTAEGCPAEGVKVELWRLGPPEHLATGVTDKDGRVPEPLLPAARFRPGRYELRFHLGAYFAARGLEGGDPRYLDVVPVRIGLAGTEAHYHVPLLCSPWGYTTYRGS